MQKLYCYVDETGQDTSGKFFLVAAVVLGTERDTLLPILEAIEHKTGKGKIKWIRTKPEIRQVYMEVVLAESVFQGHLMYAVYRNTTNYPLCLAQTTATAIKQMAEPDYKATIIVDGLEGKQKQHFTNLIRSLGVRHKTVRGIRDETDAFIRLADAVCGFARAGLNDHPVFAPLLMQAQAQKHVLVL